MSEDRFCLVCGANLDESVGHSGICPHCGKYSLFVSDQTYWFHMERNDGKDDFFYIFRTKANDIWVEIYDDEEKFIKLVNALLIQKDVKIIEKEKDVNWLKYKRKGHIFEIRFLSNGRSLIDPLWMGEKIIALTFVKKDNPKFKIYKKELARLCSLLDEINGENIASPKCPKCKSENIQPYTVTGDQKSRNTKITVGVFIGFMIFMCIFALLGGEPNLFWPIFLGAFLGTPVCLVIGQVVKKIPMRNKTVISCKDCDTEFSRAALQKKK